MLQEGFELDTATSSAQLYRQRRRETATKEKESQICQLFKAKTFLTFLISLWSQAFSCPERIADSGRYWKPVLWSATFRCRSGSDSNFVAYPDPDPDRHQNDADPHADPTPSSTHGEKSK
jgi:hypothetical protein